MPGMKITAIRATPINIPLEAPYFWSYGSLAGFSKCIVEVETDQGLTGLGEAPSPAMAATIQGFAARLVGRDAFDITGAETACLPSWRGVAVTTDFARIRAFGAVEMALWDLRGKAWNQPLYQLLGGAVRKQVPVTDYFGFRGRDGAVGGETTPEQVVDYCLRQHEERGTTFFEGKFYEADTAPSLRMVRLLREALPTAMIRLDSNMSYSLTEARRLARALADLDIRNWEDPCATPEELAQLRQHTAIPFSIHSTDLRRYAALGVPDAVCTDVNVHGGIARTVRFVGACEALGIDFWLYSGDSGVASAAYLHLAAALSWIREPSQSLYRMQPIDVIAEGPFRPRANTIPVPEGPGLGVTLAPGQLAHCHRLFVEHGAYDKFHDPDRPNTFRRLPLA